MFKNLTSRQLQDFCDQVNATEDKLYAAYAATFGDNRPDDPPEQPAALEKLRFKVSLVRGKWQVVLQAVGHVGRGASPEDAMVSVLKLQQEWLTYWLNGGNGEPPKNH